MQLQQTIRNRDDLTALQASDPSAHASFMDYLSRSLTVTVDVAQYPENYGKHDYQGATINPVYEQRQDTRIIARYGLTPADF